MKYRFKIKHDNGTFNLICYADSLNGALKQVMDAEKCPERAILEIKITEK